MRQYRSSARHNFFARYILAAFALHALLLLSCPPLSAQTPAVQNTVKSDKGSDDPAAHALLSKTAKWMNAASDVEILFDACVADSRSLQAPRDCQRGSLVCRGQKFRLTLGPQTYYCDGQNLWAYVPQNKEVSVYAYDETQAQLNPVSLIKNYRKYYRAKYIRQENMAGSARNILDLTPLSPSDILKVRLFLNAGDNLPYRLELYYAQDQIQVLRIHACREAKGLKDKDFVFDTSLFPNVMINDMR